MQKVTLDTNKIISTPEILNNKTIDIYIPFTVVRELDKLKQHNVDLKPAIQIAFKIIIDRWGDDNLHIVDVPTESITNDEIIVNSARNHNSKMYTEDMGARVIALARGVELYEDRNDDIDNYDPTYIGYREMTIDSGIYYSNWQSDVSFIHSEIEEVLEMAEADRPVLNESLVLYPDDGTDEFVVFKKIHTVYIKLKQSLRLLKKAGVSRKIEFRHAEQVIAFNNIFRTDTPLTIIQGEVGSGKTLISLMAAIARTFGESSNMLYDKILLTRAPVPINKSFELGFMPGEKEDKMAEWISGFTSNLKFLFEVNKREKEENRAYELLQLHFEPVSIASIQGLSVNDQILIVDEAQLLDSNTLKQVMSRIADGSKLVLLLDPKQTYGANRGNEGYKKILPYCKNNPMIDFINLQHIQRSELTKMVNDIFAD